MSYEDDDLCRMCGESEKYCECIHCEQCLALMFPEDVVWDARPTHGDSIIKSTPYCSACRRNQQEPQS